MFKSIIIEDEPLAASLLEKYALQYPDLENVGSFRNAIEAKTFLPQNEVDLIFLDLHLPKIKGFDFLESLEKKYHIILTTAYSEYALEGFEKGVIDYLLKPILFPRFELAVNRLKELVSTTYGAKNILTIQVNKSRIRLYEKDITYIESNKGYVNIFDKNDHMHRTKMATRTIHKLLSTNFLRIHKSYIINKKYVTTLSSSELVLNGSISIPIGRKFKEKVISCLTHDFNSSCVFLVHGT